jgi:ABC-type branched-subunit amino acid transport system substrate-binding protein
MAQRSLRVGAFAPLSRPGLVPAGHHLRAGLELGAEDVNGAGGIDGRSLELALCDSAGTADRAISSLHELERAGVVAIAGEYHSAVAWPLAELAHARALPFVCASATLDRLTRVRAPSVVRIAAPQSYGWRVYAEYLVASGHRHVALGLVPDQYWSSGADVIETRLHEAGAVCTRIDVTGQTARQVVDRVRRTDGVTAVLLLAGYPQPSLAITKTLRSDHRFDDVVIGDPAGRAEFREWIDLLGDDGIGVPYLRYTSPPEDERGQRVARQLSKRLGEPASFVALEGYDAIQVVAEAMRIADEDHRRLAAALADVDIRGTRGRLRFSRASGLPVLQWVWPPVQVAAHTDAARPDLVTVLHEQPSRDHPQPVAVT